MSPTTMGHAVPCRVEVLEDPTNVFAGVERLIVAVGATAAFARIGIKLAATPSTREQLARALRGVVENRVTPAEPSQQNGPKS
jgi:hypothetical protein